MSLADLVARQGGVVRRSQLVAHLGEAGARRALRAGTWLAVRRDAYAPARLLEAADPRRHHLLGCAAAVLVSRRDLVVAGSSAVVAHGWRRLHPHAGPPVLLLPRPAGAPPASVGGLLAAGLPPGHRTLRDGLPVTTPARTVADAARSWPYDDAVVLADAALHAGLDRSAVLDVLVACEGWPGIDAARRAVLFADARTESVLESLARVWLRERGLPPPVPQAALCSSDDGWLLGRVDLFWPEHHTVLELDGRVKYDHREALWQEKQREDRLRERGLEVVRGTWADRRDRGAALAVRVRRAFARAAARTSPRSYAVLRPSRAS